ncbi:MAG: efflux transporter outer membrane subunit [Gammaproteobacteria bacterium]
MIPQQRITRFMWVAMGMILPLLTTGCAWFGQPSERARMIAAPRLTATLAASHLPVGDGWPESDWWSAFASPELNRLVETAVADSPDLKIAAARLRQSQAMVDVQAAELYPTVQANASFSAQRYSDNSTQAKLAGEHFRQLLINPLVLRYRLDLWGRDKASLQAAVGRAMADEAERAEARLLLSSAVAGAYFDLAAASERLEISERIVSYRERLLQLFQVRLKNGLVSVEPLLSARLDLNRARQREAGISAEVALRKNLLAALAGKGSDWGLGIAAESAKAPRSPVIPADLPLHLLARRPDVLAARLKVEAAAQEIEAARAAFYPDVNLVSFAGLHSVSLSDVLLQGSSLAYAVGPSLEFPIFEGGRLRAKLDYREAAYDEAVERYNSQVLRAVREVADSLAHWREAEAKLSQQRRSMAAIDATLHLAEVLHSQGLNDRIELIRARTAEYGERLRLAELQGGICKAAAQVLVALGGGYAAAAAK